MFLYVNRFEQIRETCYLLISNIILKLKLIPILYLKIFIIDFKPKKIY